MKAKYILLLNNNSKDSYFSKKSLVLACWITHLIMPFKVRGLSTNLDTNALKL